MPQCPQCNKPLRELVRRCPSCQADLDLLVDYVSNLRGSLDRALELTRAGELGQAVWAYLAVLEVDPDNTDARRQVAQVATAVRQFDMSSPARQWLAQRNGEGKRSRTSPDNWLIYALGAAVVAIAFALGYLVGNAAGDSQATDQPANPPAPLQRPNSTLSGD